MEYGKFTITQMLIVIIFLSFSIIGIFRWIAISELTDNKEADIPQWVIDDMQEWNADAADVNSGNRSVQEWLDKWSDLDIEQLRQ